MRGDAWGLEVHRVEYFSTTVKDEPGRPSTSSSRSWPLPGSTSSPLSRFRSAPRVLNSRSFPSRSSTSARRTAGGPHSRRPALGNPDPGRRPCWRTRGSPLEAPPSADQCFYAATCDPRPGTFRSIRGRATSRQLWPRSMFRSRRQTCYGSLDEGNRFGLPLRAGSERRAAAYGARMPDTSPTSIVEWADFMRAQGVTRVCCLLDAGQLAGFPLNLEAEYKRLFGATCVLMESSLTTISAHGKRSEEIFCRSCVPPTGGERAVIHCWGGNGRTGHVLAAWLVAARGLSPMEAIEAVEATGRIPREAVLAGNATLDELIELLRVANLTAQPNPTSPTSSRTDRSGHGSIWAESARRHVGKFLGCARRLARFSSDQARTVLAD